MDVLGIVGIALALGFVGLVATAWWMRRLWRRTNELPWGTKVVAGIVSAAAQNAHQPEHAHQRSSVLVVRVFNRAPLRGSSTGAISVDSGIGRSERPVGVCDVNASKRAVVSSRPREKTIGVVKGPTRVGVLIDRRSASTGGIVGPRLDASGRTVYPRSE